MTWRRLLILLCATTLLRVIARRWLPDADWYLFGIIVIAGVAGSIYQRTRRVPLATVTNNRIEEGTHPSTVEDNQSMEPAADERVSFFYPPGSPFLTTLSFLFCAFFGAGSLVPILRRSAEPADDWVLFVMAFMFIGVAGIQKMMLECLGTVISLDATGLTQRLRNGTTTTIPWGDVKSIRRRLGSPALTFADDAGRQITVWPALRDYTTFLRAVGENLRKPLSS